MTYAEWSAMSESERNAMCAEKVMGWEKAGSLSSPVICWVQDGGLTGHTSEGWSPVTDRNATVMLVEEVVRRGYHVRRLMRIEMYNESEDVACGYFEKISILDPSLIAYCCVRACEEA